MSGIGLDRRSVLRLGGLAALGVATGCRPGRAPSARSTPRAGPTSAGPAADLAALAGDLRGPLLRPGDPGYDTARLLYDPRFDGAHPAAIARCTGTDDVVACVGWARRTGTPVAVRAGGHSYLGASTGPGLVVDLTGMAGVNADGSTARIGGGALLVDVYAGLAAADRAIVAGSCPTVGFGGLACCGGLGIVNRAWGLTIDAVRAVEVVTADGRVLTCAADEHPDLFFAMRGAGASYGVATAFTVATEPAPAVAAATLRWDYPHAAATVDGWQRWLPALPEPVWSTCHLTADRSAPPSPAARVHVTCLDGAAALDAELDRLTALVGATPARRVTQTRDWLATALTEAGCAGESVDACHLPGQRPGGTLRRERMAAGSVVVARSLPVSAIDPVVAAVAARSAGTGTAGVLLDSLGGRVAAVPVGATAFPHRTAAYTVQVVAGWDSASAGAARDARRWVDGVRGGLAPASSGAYAGYADAGLADYAEQYWGPNLPRLRAVKRSYDPDGMFDRGQPVR